MPVGVTPPMPVTVAVKVTLVPKTERFIGLLLRTLTVGVACVTVCVTVPLVTV